MFSKLRTWAGEIIQQQENLQKSPVWFPASTLVRGRRVSHPSVIPAPCDLTPSGICTDMNALRYISICIYINIYTDLNMKIFKKQRAKLCIGVLSMTCIEP